MGWLEAVADPIRLAIVRHLAGKGPAQLNELAAAADASRETVRRHVAHLQRAGVVEALPPVSDGERRGRPPVRYRLTAETTADTAPRPQRRLRAYS